MKDDREIISVKDFRQKFCNECYWHKWNGCDIKIVTLYYCCHSGVDQCEYKIESN